MNKLLKICKKGQRRVTALVEMNRERVKKGQPIKEMPVHPDNGNGGGNGGGGKGKKG